MPAASGVKRVRGKRIERPFIIGSEAWPLPPVEQRDKNLPEDHTKGWRVYVRAPPGQPDITRWLSKVQFKIYQTYANPARVVETPPFQVEETGWGGFQVDIRLYFKEGLKSEQRSHWLQLEPYGDEAQIAQQTRDQLVRAEVLDWVEFNEPPEALFDALTDDMQFASGRGRGKGGAKRLAGTDGTSSVELPAEATLQNRYSRQEEQKLLELFKKAEAELEEEIVKTRQLQTTLQNELKELRETAA